MSGRHPHADHEFSAQRAAAVRRGCRHAPPTEGPLAEFIKALQERINNGIDPLYVGELVREAIENDWPYIFTDTEHEPFIDKRFAAIKQGFDRIRGRTPRR